MINRFIGVGRIATDLELRMTQTGMAICKFTLAINRRKDEETDFLRCVCFGKTAELLTEYQKKGNMLGIDGRIQTGSYDDKNGNKVYTTDIICDYVSFLTPRESVDGQNRQSGTNTYQTQQSVLNKSQSAFNQVENNDDFDIDVDLPF